MHLFRSSQNLTGFWFWEPALSGTGHLGAVSLFEWKSTTFPEKFFGLGFGVLARNPFGVLIMHSWAHLSGRIRSNLKNRNFATEFITDGESLGRDPWNSIFWSLSITRLDF